MDNLIDCGSYLVYVPNNCKNNTDVAIYYPGGGNNAWKSDSATLVEYIDTNPNKIVVINKNRKENTELIFSGLKEIEQQNNIKVGDVNILGHSSADSQIINMASKASGYGYQVKNICVLDTADSSDKLYVSTKEAQAIAESGTTMVFFDRRTDIMNPNEDHYENMKTLIKHKVPMVYVVCSSPKGYESYNWDVYQKHYEINNEVIANGIIDYFSGDINSLGKNRSFKYDYWTYDYEKNSWVSISETDADKILSNRKNLSNVTLEKVTSDDKYLESELNGILSVVNSLNINDVSCDISVGSTTKVPSQEPSVVNDIIISSIALLDKIKLEIQKVAYVGAAYNDMDNLLKGEASKLNMSVTSSQIASVPLNDISSIKTEYTISEKADNAMRTITGEQKKSSATKTSSYSGYSNYNLSSGQVNSGISQSDNNNKEQTQTTNIQNLENHNETHSEPSNQTYQELKTNNEPTNNDVTEKIQSPLVTENNKTIQHQEAIKEPVTKSIVTDKEPIIDNGYISPTKTNSKIISKILTATGITAITGAAVAGAKYGIEKIKNNNNMDDDEFTDEEEK